VSAGELTLDEREAHHLRDVLRLTTQTPVEIFDHAGNVGVGYLDKVSANQVTVLIQSIHAAPTESFRLILASAVPKAARGDWMVEKLSELGVDTFIPLATERSVVLPEGKNKLDRWRRLASEASKQSHRSGVMQIESLTPLSKAILAAKHAGQCWHLSTAPDAAPIRKIATQLSANTVALFIGPEGGWSPEEEQQFLQLKIPAVSLTQTILRIETAAIAAAAVVTTMLSRDS
jgi:16S rRNA (uracil1498-N3)-methyltransferase